MDERYIADLLLRAYDALADEEAREERYLADLLRAYDALAEEMPCQRGIAMPTDTPCPTGHPMSDGEPRKSG